MLAILAVIACLLLYLAKTRQYLTLPAVESAWPSPIRWFHVAIAFAIYFACVLLSPPLIIKALSSSLQSAPKIADVTWLNFLTSFLILSLLTLYFALLPQGISWKILQKNHQNSIWQNVKAGLITFLIAFPLVLFCSEFLDFVLHSVFKIAELPDQLAVRFLKMTFQYPVYFLLSVITIIGLAPILEETLFRGFLQSFLREKLGAKAAIVITSFLFSSFHYSSVQGMANISIIGSLFVFSLFLGFIYEKQGALLSSVTLHSLFNSFSVINLYFFEK